MTEHVTIRSAHLTATVSPLGAELQSLTDADGAEYLWHGDPAWWNGRAPLLFPVVGRLNGDTLRLGDAQFPMPQHGFARRSMFELVEQTPSSVCFRLQDDAATRAIYPFAFRLDARFEIDRRTLSTSVTIGNTGSAPLPASFGFHPAFAWPLPGAPSRSEHVITFERDEPASLHVVTPDGLIGGATRASPVVGRTLRLRDDLFAHDALVWTDVASRSVRYGAAGGPALDIAFPDTPHLGIWTKPGAPFVCVEPWAGHADPPGYEGDFRDKPGVFTVAPGGERVFRMTITLVDPTNLSCGRRL